MTLSEPIQFHTRKGIALQALIPLRSQPSESSEMVSQLLFGEMFQVLEIAEKWLKIETTFDHYTGWIDRKLFAEMTVTSADHPIHEVVQFARIAEIDLPDGSQALIPAGSTLSGYDPEQNTIIIQGEPCRISSPFGSILCTHPDDKVHTANQFLNAPYVWGGRSPFGFDCSGFVQTVYHIHGISLARDASQQAKSGEAVHGICEALPGDLAYFYNEGGKISHVGLLDGRGKIIHCSGRVRVDSVDDAGIRHAATGKLTHPLAMIRRMV